MRRAAAIAISVALAATPAAASAAGGSRLLLETCFQPPFEEAHSEFHTVRPDGRGARMIRRFPTLGPADCAHRYPNWSPDGRRIAYMSGDAIAVGPSTWRRRWRRDRIVTRIGQWPAWSPDGRWIALVRRERDVINSIAVVPAAGGRVRRLVKTNDLLEWPSWSSDGRHVLYSTNEPGDPVQIRMWRVRADGRGRPRTLGEGRSADASPDGRRVAFITAHALWTMNSDGSGRRRIVRHSARGMMWRLAWSPDGRRIAYVYYPSSGDPATQIRIARATGGGDRAVKLRRRLRPVNYVHWGS